MDEQIYKYTKISIAETSPGLKSRRGISGRIDVYKRQTLMNMISGIYYTDEGQIFVDGKPVDIRSPKDAFDLGIGMIHQHFKLVDVFTALELSLIHIS